MADDAKLSLILAAKDFASREVNKLHGSLGKLHTGVGKVGGGFKTAGANVAKFGLIAGAGALVGIGALAAGLIGAAKASADESTGIARLSASLKANIKGWKGNTTAIEARIAAQEKLGFSDDAQRESLAKLVIRYGSLSRAQQVQTLAMDYARLKNVDLVTATDAVAKGLDGNSKVLKTLGIDYKAGGDKASLFGQIQDKVKGQAAAFANTAVGAWESVKITFGDVVEDLGALVLPMFAKLGVFVRDQVVPALSQIVHRVGQWIAANQPLIQQVGGFVSGAMSALFSIIGTVVGALAGKGKGGGLIATVVHLATQVATYVIPKVQGFVGALVDAGKSVGKVVGPIVKSLLPAFGKIVAALFGGGSSSTGGGKKGPGKKGGTTSGGGGGLVGAIGSLIGVLWGDGNGPLAVALKGAGAVLSWLANNVIGPLIDRIADLIGWVKDAITWLNSLNLVTQHTAQESIDYHTGKGRAGGGPMFPGQTYRIAENRDEIVTMGNNGTAYVSPSAPQRVDGGGGGGETHIHVYLDGKEVFGLLDARMYRALRRAAPTGGRI